MIREAFPLLIWKTSQGGDGCTNVVVRTYHVMVYLRFRFSGVRGLGFTMVVPFRGMEIPVIAR